MYTFDEHHHREELMPGSFSTGDEELSTRGTTRTYLLSSMSFAGGTNKGIIYWALASNVSMQTTWLPFARIISLNPHSTSLIIIIIITNG